MLKDNKYLISGLDQSFSNYKFKYINIFININKIFIHLKFFYLYKGKIH